MAAGARLGKCFQPRREWLHRDTCDVLPAATAVQTEQRQLPTTLLGRSSCTWLCLAQISVSLCWPEPPRLHAPDLGLDVLARAAQIACPRSRSRCVGQSRPDCMPQISVSMCWPEPPRSHVCVPAGKRAPGPVHGLLHLRPHDRQRSPHCDRHPAREGCSGLPALLWLCLHAPLLPIAFCCLLSPSHSL